MAFHFPQMGLQIYSLHWNCHFSPNTTNGPQKSFIALSLKCRREFIRLPKWCCKQTLPMYWHTDGSLFTIHSIGSYANLSPSNQSKTCLTFFPASFLSPRNHHTFLSQSFSVLSSLLLIQLYHLFHSNLEP